MAALWQYPGMASEVRNLLHDLPPAGADESFEPLHERPGLRIERIVSRGHVTPPDQWYDQEQDEWVLLLGGAARLDIEGQDAVALRPGDSVFLAAHQRHRVAWTAPDEPTIWLAVHCFPDPTEPVSKT